MGGPTAGARDAFVGRTRELELLGAQLEEVRRGSPRVVLVEGDPGIGKTALLRRFLAASHEVRVLWASGDEAEVRLPFGVVAQLLGAATAVANAAEVGRAPAAGDDPLAVGAGLVQVLGILGATGPVAVAVDDAQWADGASLQALTFALRRLLADPVLALFSTRESVCLLPESLRRLARDRGMVVGVQGLGLSELATFATRATGKVLPHRVVERLRDHTGGNPLYFETLLEELDPAALGRWEGPLPAPRSFAMVIVSQLASCSRDARALIQAAAVLGPRCPLGGAARVAGLDSPAVALEEAVEAGVLEMAQTAAGRVIAFQHPLVRSAVYHDLGPARRSELHARAASVTDGRARLDHRIAAALVEDADLASEVAAHARKEAGKGAVVAAAAYSVAAARLTPDPADRERLLLDALEQLLLGGEVAEASRLIDDVEALADSVRRRYLLGQHAFLRGDRRAAEELLVRAWEGCQAGDEEELGALVCLHLARLCSTDLRLDEAVAWSQRVAGAGDRPDLLAPALGVLVPCLGAAGRADESLALAAALPDATAPLGIHDIEGILGRGLVRMWIDDLPGARADLSTVVEATRSRPASASGLIALSFLAEAEYRAGGWDDSIAHGHLAVSLALDSDQLWLAPFAHTAASWAPAARGDWPAADRHVDGAITAARRLGDAASLTCAACAAAHASSMRADHAAVLEAVQPLLELEERGTPTEPGVHPWRELRAEALLNLGRFAEAEEALEALEAMAQARGRRSSLATAARLLGALAAARGDAGGARHWFELALDHSRDLPLPFHRALLELAYGAFLRRAGERRSAAAHLSEAHGALSRLAATPFLERCEAELAGCGLSPRLRCSSPAPHVLTPQELAVAKLVAAGATNREVASQLVLSVKTVEYHLANVFVKLSISSRRQLADRLPAPS